MVRQEIIEVRVRLMAGAAHSVKIAVVVTVKVRDRVIPWAEESQDPGGPGGAVVAVAAVVAWASTRSLGERVPDSSVTGWLPG